MIKIKVTAFGALGHLTSVKPFVFEVKYGTKLVEVSQKLKQEIVKNFPEFNDFRTLERSALANVEEILNNKDYQFIKDEELVILPPICGG